MYFYFLLNATYSGVWTSVNVYRIKTPEAGIPPFLLLGEEGKLPRAIIVENVMLPQMAPTPHYGQGKVWN